MTCGTPTPATTRVVQIRTGPDADLDRVGAGVDQRLGRLAGRDVAGDDLELARQRRVMRATISITPREWPCAVSTTSTSAPAAISACARSSASGPTPTAAPTRSRPCGSFVACGNSTRFWMSLTVIRPVSAPVGVDDRQLLDAVPVQQLLGLARASCRPAR